VSTANKIQVVQCLLLTNWIGKQVSAANKIQIVQEELEGPVISGMQS
jgi:hypothetical protein